MNTSRSETLKPIALLSVSNKKGLEAFAKTLVKEHGYQLLSSGGTAACLEKAGIQVKRVAEYTGAPEILGGRVKTLHPRIHGGILANRENSDHITDLKNENINAIDLVVVNLYPFEETIKEQNVSWEKAIENIDIGGPTMVRAAAKNHAYVSILTRPEQYQYFLEALKKGSISKSLRKELALEAFEHTAAYDVAISRWLQKNLKSENSPWLDAIPHKQTLRYGENPHQSAVWYSKENAGWGGAKQLQGKELSTNNLIDLEAALSTIQEFGYGADDTLEKAAVIIKHCNPCGVAISSETDQALKMALAADPVSAFGGIVALNSTVDVTTANKLKTLFLECIVAPQFEEEAKNILAEKNNLRLLEMNSEAIEKASRNNFKSILGGLLVQEADDKKVDSQNWKLVTKKMPNEQEKFDLTFAWKVVRHVRSNAIVVATSGQTLGIGAGQMNRVGSAKIALDAAGDNAQGSVLASDGFFPFDDTIKLAAKYGIKSIIQPGGSIRDEESIKACDELDLSMIFTGRRHFLH